MIKLTLALHIALTEIEIKLFSDFYHITYYTSLIIGALIGLLYITKVNAPFKYLCFLIIITLFSELLAKYFVFGLKINSNIIYHFFVIVEYGFYCIIFHYLFESKKVTKFLLLSFLLLTVGEIGNTIFFQSINVSNTTILILEAILLVVWSLFLFRTIRDEDVIYIIFLKPTFCFSSAVLIYYSCNTLIWGFHSLKIYKLVRPPIIIYDINLILSGILYLFFSF